MLKTTRFLGNARKKPIQKFTNVVVLITLAFFAGGCGKVALNNNSIKKTVVASNALQVSESALLQYGIRFIVEGSDVYYDDELFSNFYNTSNASSRAAARAKVGEYLSQARPAVSSLTGNDRSILEQKVTLADGFYSFLDQ